MAESFFASLKNERVHRTVYPTREHAREDVARYIEFRYNSSDSTRDSATEPRKKFTTSTSIDRSQRNQHP